MASLPEWMLPRQTPEPLAPALSRRQGTHGITRKALASLAETVAKSVADEACASRPGILQSIDARAKLLGVAILIVVTTLVHGHAALAVCCAACIAAGMASRVPARRMLGVWLVVPLFSGLVMLPATLNIVTDGRPLWVIARFGADRFGPWALPRMLTVTDTGLLAAARMVLRTAACMSLVTLLASTTPRPTLFRGIRALGVPRIFTALLAMMDRYVRLVIRAAEEVHLAKISRSIAPQSANREREWAAAGIASVFRRSYSLSQSVHLAMISRGYTGEVRTLDEPALHPRDWVFAAASVALAALLLLIG